MPTNPYEDKYCGKRGGFVFLDQKYTQWTELCWIMKEENINLLIPI